MSDSNTPIAIIGAGSIGERYIRNLWQLGYRNLVVFRQRNLPFRDISDATVKVVTTWDELLAARPYAAFVCTPTAMHLPQTQALVENKIHVLVEKPLSHSVEGWEELSTAVAKNKVYVHVGYMMRHHPILAHIKGLMAQNTYGKLVSIQSKWGEYLPDWHPWEDYRTSYAARKALGGGVALTLSHDLDMVNWLADSPVEQWFIMKNYASTLELDVEAGADILLRYAGGCTANVHLNYYEKNKERFLKLVFDDASVSVDFFDSTLTITQHAVKEVLRFENFDRNDLFVNQIKHFLAKTTQFSPKEVEEQIAASHLIISICNG